jgi:hypothetical protein
MVGRRDWLNFVLLTAVGVAGLLCLLPWFWLQVMTYRSATEMVLNGSRGFVYAAVDPSYAARVIDAALCRPATKPEPGEPSTGFSLCEPPMLESAVRSGAVLRLPNGTPAKLDSIWCVARSKIEECGGSGYQMQLRGQEQICKIVVTNGAGKRVTAWAARGSVRGTVPPL